MYNPRDSDSTRQVTHSYNLPNQYAMSININFLFIWHVSLEISLIRHLLYVCKCAAKMSKREDRICLFWTLLSKLEDFSICLSHKTSKYWRPLLHEIQELFVALSVPFTVINVNLFSSFIKTKYPVERQIFHDSWNTILA